MKIVAIDFETANDSLASACSLGIAIYNEGEILDNFEWYIKPYYRYNFFTNTNIHGISKEDVEDKDEFIKYYDELKNIFSESVIVAHNASFDIGVLNSVCDVYGLEHFDNEYLDTVRISRKVFPELYNHKLDTVCAYLNIDLSHHNAKSDSFGCLMILLKAMEAHNTYDLDGFISKIGVQYKRI